MRRFVEYVVVFIVLMVVLWAMGVATGGLADRQACHEDMACWDCTTMGNRICGGGAP